jgi:hypothetical protein
MVSLAVVTLACRPSSAPPAELTPNPSPTISPVASVCQPNPDPATPEFLVIDTPKPDDTVRTPFTVSGRVAAFEATFRITLFDPSGKAISDIGAMSLGGQTLARFSEQVNFPQTASGPACLWVYERSARDGSPIHVGQVAVVLAGAR